MRRIDATFGVKTLGITRFTKMSAAYFGATYIVYLVCLSSFEVKPRAFFWGFSTIVMPAVEIAFGCILGIVLMRLRSTFLGGFGMVLAPVPAIIIGLAYFIQLTSVAISGDFISVLAIENAAEIQFVTRPILLVLLAILALVWLALGYVAVTEPKPPVHTHARKRTYWSFSVAALLFVGMYDSSSGEGDPVALKPDLVPATGLARTVEEVQGRRKAAQISDAKTSAFVADVRSGRAKPGYAFDPDASLPFLRSDIGSAPFPFVDPKASDAPNVIVIFAEGLSARLMDTYGNLYSDLTPNLDAFALETTIVDNYYNHTAATFRGLHGQLASAYPIAGGAASVGWAEAGKGDGGNGRSPQYQNLANILNGRGYDTLFFSPHSNHNKLNTMLRGLDFATVHSYETVPQLLGRPVREHSGPVESAMRDTDLFESLRAVLEKRAREGNQNPFFAATYNIGTHAFFDTPSEGLKYGDGRNQALNRFRNFDAAVGAFLDYFRASPYADNTILILTTDHATFPEPAVLQALDEPSYKPYFIDRIPLLIYAPGLNLPKAYDANFRNSIDLVPTVLHLLRIEDVPNAFLGHSIFDRRYDRGYSVAAIGREFYSISPVDGVTFLGNGPNTPEIEAFVRTIDYYYRCEGAGAIFDFAVVEQRQDDGNSGGGC